MLSTSLTLSCVPAQNSITINLPSNEQHVKFKGYHSATSDNKRVIGIKTLRIFDASGKTQKLQQLSGSPVQVQIDISDLSAGVCFIEISDGKYRETQRVVIGR